MALGELSPVETIFFLHEPSRRATSTARRPASVQKTLSASQSTATPVGWNGGMAGPAGPAAPVTVALMPTIVCGRPQSFMLTDLRAEGTLYTRAQDPTRPE